MKIGFYTPNWPGLTTSNGITTSTANTVSGLRGLGHEAFIVSQEKENDDDFVVQTPPLQPFSLIDHARVRLGMPTPYYRARAQTISDCVKSLVEQHGLDAFVMEESFGWAGFVQDAVDIPVCAVLRGPWFLHRHVLPDHAKIAFNNSREKYEGAAIARCAAIVAPSKNVLDQTLDHYSLSPKWTGVFPNPMRPKPPVDPELFEKPGAVDILFVGRFDPHKGGDVLLDAFAHAVGEGVEARLSFVGPDLGVPAGDGATQMIRERLALLPEAASSRIDYLGKLSKTEIDDLRRCSPITIVPSRFENFSNTLLEAMAAGSAVIASDTGGLPEVLTHNETGLLSPPGDVKALSAAMRRLADDRNLARRLGDSARRHIEETLSPESVAARLAGFLKDVASDYANRTQRASAM
ncbi:MAG: glycosyltransferase family 4 protein [Pseudomonadota bacterium]